MPGYPKTCSFLMTTSRMTKRLVIGNWKMHGNLAENAALLQGLVAGLPGNVTADIAVCVPFPYLAQAQQGLHGSSITWGAQDISAHDKGAYTGEVSGEMLCDFGVRWALVGHSERRTWHGESDQAVAAKAAAALRKSITPVVCVGETLQEQESGQTKAVISRQLEPVLSLGEAAVSQIVIAYEPVWAIGTGRTASPEQAQAVHAYIRSLVAAKTAGHVPLLYGGSVKAANAASLFAMPDINGALVGGAALVADEFLRIAAA
jgi:triosephosphate isomerase